MGCQHVRCHGRRARMAATGIKLAASGGTSENETRSTMMQEVLAWVIILCPAFALVLIAVAVFRWRSRRRTQNRAVAKATLSDRHVE